MKLTCCSQHHYFDADKYNCCPYCQGINLNSLDSIITIDREMSWSVNKRDIAMQETDMLDKTAILDRTQLLNEEHLNEQT